MASAYQACTTVGSGRGYDRLRKLITKTINFRLTPLAALTTHPFDISFSRTSKKDIGQVRSVLSAIRTETLGILCDPLMPG
jgi:hypothetical protein